MNAEFQVKMVGYQDAGLKREIGRVVRRQLGRSSWRDWTALAARILSITLCALSFIFTFLFIIGWQVIRAQQGEVIPGNTYIVVLLVFSVCLLLVTFGIRKRSDPLKENLWPIGAALVTVTFCPEFFQVDEPYFANRVGYPAIRAVCETNSAFYLFVHDDQVLMLRKREFIQGNLEQFREFMMNKTGELVEYRKY